MTHDDPSGVHGAALGGAQTTPEAHRDRRELAAAVKNSIDVAGHTLAALEQALANLRLIGAPDDTELRVKISASFSADGGYARRLTGHWKP